MQESLTQAAHWLRETRKAVALTGAGVSTESGIPDFRSTTGLWTRFDPAEYATIEAFRRDPVKVWRMLAELEQLLDARPNAGHYALAELESAGGLAGIVTQNIDGLHQAAGSRSVVEYHGSSRSFSCLSCGSRYPREQVRTLALPPRCTCQAVLKPDVVLFGELIPEEAVQGAATLLSGVDLLLVIGTSCEVWPASEIPGMVQSQGGRVVEINLEACGNFAPDLLLPGSFGSLVPALLARWKELAGEVRPRP